MADFYLKDHSTNVNTFRVMAINKYTKIFFKVKEKCYFCTEQKLSKLKENRR